MGQPYSNLADAKANAVQVITSASVTNGWPASVRDLALADVDAAASGADGWFSSDSSEAAAFWAQLQARAPSWDQTQKGMDKVDLWLGATITAANSAAATIDAQSVSTILSDTAVASAQTAQTAVTTATDPKTLYALAAIAVAVLAWKVLR